MFRTVEALPLSMMMSALSRLLKFLQARIKWKGSILMCWMWTKSLLNSTVLELWLNSRSVAIQPSQLLMVQDHRSQSQRSVLSQVTHPVIRQVTHQVTLLVMRLRLYQLSSQQLVQLQAQHLGQPFHQLLDQLCLQLCLQLLDLPFPQLLDQP